MSNLPADWAIEKAHKLLGWGVGWATVKTGRSKVYDDCIEFARYIEAHEEPPVDRKLLCAREAAAERYPIARREIEEGEWDEDGIIIDLMEALIKYEEGFGKDRETTAPQCQ